MTKESMILEKSETKSCKYSGDHSLSKEILSPQKIVEISSEFTHETGITLNSQLSGNNIGQPIVFRFLC